METRKPADNKAKPFPRRCLECGELQVQPTTIAYEGEVKHDGRVHTIRVAQLNVNKCGACGEVFFTNVADEQISQALRERLSLLSPDDIRRCLEDLRLRQKDFAERIGVAPETVSRWLSGTQIQSRAMDNLMRLFFRFSNVREALSGPAWSGTLNIDPAARSPG
jgi:putative zinc finger/helix-turn-helix YgiT family protein